VAGADKRESVFLKIWGMRNTRSDGSVTRTSSFLWAVISGDRQVSINRLEVSGFEVVSTAGLTGLELLKLY